MKKKQRLIAAKADARVALSGLIAQDADLSLLDKLLAKLAMDAKDDDETVAEDESDDDLYEDDPDNEGKRRKKVVAAADADDTPVKPEVTKAAMDAAIAAAVTANGIKVRGEVEALHVARSEVRSMVGEIALDSAEAVYKFALDHAKVDTAGVHPSAFRALVKLAGAPKAAEPRHALDSAAAVKVVEQFPEIGRLGRA